VAPAEPLPAAEPVSHDRHGRARSRTMPPLIVPLPATAGPAPPPAAAAVLQILQVAAVAVERPAAVQARPAAPVAGLRGARTGVVGPGPAGAPAALADPGGILISRAGASPGGPPGVTAPGLVARRRPTQRRKPKLCPARTSRSLPGSAAAASRSGAAALLVRGRFSCRGLRLGVRLRPRLLVAAAVVLRKLGHLGQDRTWRSAGGRRDSGGGSGRGELPARLARLRLRRLHGLAAALGDGQPASEQAKTDQRSPPRPTRWVAALLGSLPGHHVHLRPPAPADWVALLFPCSRGMKRTASPMAWRQPGKLQSPRTPQTPRRRRPRHPGYWPVVPGRRLRPSCRIYHRFARGQPCGPARSRSPT
jgi:hypothetical protein